MDYLNFSRDIDRAYVRHVQVASLLCKTRSHYDQMVIEECMYVRWTFGRDSSTVPDASIIRPYGVKILGPHIVIHIRFQIFL
jgi:hypothetical protein